MAKQKPREQRAPLEPPGRGSRISDEHVARFREAYLRFGYVSAAAREVGLSPSSCRKIADDADNDPDFAKARTELLARGLDKVETMLLRSTELAAERIEAGPTVDATGAIVDLGPQYFRGITDAHRSLVARRAKEAPDDSNKGPLEVVIRRAVAGKAEAEPVQENTSPPEVVKSS